MDDRRGIHVGDPWGTGFVLIGEDTGIALPETETETAECYCDDDVMY